MRQQRATRLTSANLSSGCLSVYLYIPSYTSPLRVYLQENAYDAAVFLFYIYIYIRHSPRFFVCEDNCVTPLHSQTLRGKKEKKHGNIWYEVRWLLRWWGNVLTTYCGLALQTISSLVLLSSCSMMHLQWAEAGRRWGPWRQSSAQARALRLAWGLEVSPFSLRKTSTLPRAQLGLRTGGSAAHASVCVQSSASFQQGWQIPPLLGHVGVNKMFFLLFSSNSRCVFKTERTFFFFFARQDFGETLPLLRPSELSALHCLTDALLNV